MNVAPTPVIDVEAVIANMEGQFSHEAPFDYTTVAAVGGIAVDQASGNWVAAGRARIPGMYQESAPLSAALETGLKEQAEAAGLQDYRLHYTEQTGMRHFLDQLQNSHEDDEDDDEDDDEEADERGDAKLSVRSKKS